MTVYLDSNFRGGLKNMKFRRDFGQVRDLIANSSGKQQDIVNRKTVLQTTETLPYKQNDDVS